jgi:guanylate kinase
MLLIALVGESGAGKTTLETNLSADGYAQKLISTTSRAKRASDADNAYYFVTREEFENSDQFLEKEIYGNNYYGLSKAELKRVKDKACFVCTLGGYEQIVAKIDFKAILFYITCDKEILKNRMLSRGDSLESIESRLAQDKSRFNDIEEISKYNNFEIVVIDKMYPAYKIDTSNLNEVETLELVKKIIVGDSFFPL